MRNKFNVNAERLYYKKHELPRDYFSLDADTVERILVFCSNSKEWPKLIKENKVLELGAGECPYTDHILNRVEPRLYIASDLFPERIHQKKGSLKSSVMAYLGANVLSLPLKNDSVDFCMAQGLLHHIPNLEDAVAEISRVVKKEGHFLFREPWAGNPLVWLKYKIIEKSPNEFPLTRGKIVDCLRLHGFQLLHFTRFWLRFPKLPPGPWSVNLGGLARKI